MSYTLRKSKDRAFFDHGWLKTYHTFSFASYYDPRYENFRSLRVINEDRVDADKGFPSHSHRNMEIITYVLSGELAHRDSLGTESILHTNELQLMHAGSGITHSEYNPSPTDPVQFLQIWLIPNKQNVAPGYQQVMPQLKKNNWTLIASKDGQDSLTIYNDSKIFLADVEPETKLPIKIEHYGYLQVMSGSFMLNDTFIEHGDGIAFDEPGTFSLIAKTAGKVILFELE